MEGQDVLIIANGESLGCEAALARGRVVVALDGAADRLLDLAPDIILGDFDSLQEPKRWGVEATFHQLKGNEQPYRRRNVLIVPALDQDRTDLEKALEYCKRANSICIVNALGGRADHTMSSIGCLRRYPLAHIRTATDKMRFFSRGVYSLSGSKGARCAIFGFPKATVTTHGLAYELDSLELEVGAVESTSNQIARVPATIKIEGDALVIEQA